MSSTNIKVVCLCDICGDEMSEQSDGAFVCWHDSYRIPSDQLYRYAEHITLHQTETEVANNGN
jgi:uncharacterized circularly permuted ATP-grasp superfamily protein